MAQLEISKRQQEIIRTAGKILTISGVNGLTTKNLAAEMKFSESALYRHFKNKAQIIETMLLYLECNMDERLQKIITENGTAEENLRALFTSQCEFFNENPYFAVAVFSDGLMEESQEINLVIKKIMAVKYKYLLKIIRKGQQQGFFNQNIETSELIHIVLGSFRLLMFKWRINNFNFDISKQGQQTLETLLTLMRPCNKK